MSQLNRISLIHEAPLHNVQKQGMREPLPLPDTQRAGPENRAVEGLSMSACGTCQRTVAPFGVPSRLFEIRRGYQAEWNGLKFLVESDSNDWTLCVQDFENHRTLYTARRAQARAAKLMAAEFAVFRVFGGDSPVSPDRLANDLQWQEYW